MIHHVPELHPDDVTVVRGLSVTTVARTLVDLAEEMDREELVATFERARRMGLLDIADVRASASRVEWRPSLALLHEVADGFAPRDGA